MKPYSLFFLLLLLPSAVVFAQSENLVKNYSFEEYEKCPDDYVPQDHSHKFIPGWTYPTYATPDYFNRCAPKRDLGVSVPRNFAGISEPHSGDGYAGLILSGTDDGYREYIQGTLSKPMEAGKMYCITYYYRLASFSKFAVDRLSMYLSETKVESESLVNLSVKPQVNNEEGLFLDNSEKWEEKCLVYTAKGGEQFFVIGNFKSYANTNYVATDKEMKNALNKSYAYYYIDDVIIRPLDNCTDCGCVMHDFETQIIDSSYTGEILLTGNKMTEPEEDGHIKIALAGGTPPYSISWSNGMKSSEISGLSYGKYSYLAKDKYNCRSKGEVVFKKPVIEIDKFEKGIEEIKEGESIILKNIFFEYGKTTLLPESYPELDKVVKFINDKNVSLIEISGHTDNDGPEAFNQRLSEGRAKSVVEYLQSKGIAAARMKAVGYGESKPIETNLTPEGMAINRRVEFTLLKL